MGRGRYTKTQLENYNNKMSKHRLKCVCGHMKSNHTKERGCMCCDCKKFKEVKK